MRSLRWLCPPPRGFLLVAGVWALFAASAVRAQDDLTDDDENDDDDD